MPGLLATKLHRPSIPAKWVQRLHLIQRLNEGLELNRQVTLVSAPAGFGKTTCTSNWVNALDRWSVAWLSLDSADDDPERFLNYLIAALQGVNPGLGQEIEGVLRSGQIPPSEITSTVLINDILAFGDRFILILDDFHTIQDPFILQVFEQLLTSFPDPLHLVLITREDPPLPLARLRANNQLTEIRARDLRFTHRDIDRLLNELMGLSLSQADIAALEDKTEGWIVGLQLAAIAMQSPLSVRDRANPSGFIASLGGSHRFILSYLTEQVLNQQAEEVQHFLLQTSILDTLHGDLCNAVTGRSDSHVLLEQLLKANLFLIPLDDERQWYRYHHLFADLLRELLNALQRDNTTELHRRASHWYAKAGMTSDAIQHALAAEEYALAVGLLESHAMDMIMQGYARTVSGWVQALPAEWSSQNPRTNLAFAWMHLLRGAYTQAFPYLDRLEASLSSSQLSEEEGRSLEAEWLVMQSLRLIMQGKMTESLTLAEKALEIVPEKDSRVRSLAYFGCACAYQVMDSYNLAVDAYQKAIQHGRAAENSIAELMSVSGLAQLAFEHGQLHLAHEIAAPVSAQLEDSGSPPPISTVVFGILGEIYIQWYQTDQARSYIQRALQFSTLGGYNSGIAGCRVLLSRLEQLEGNLDAAAQENQIAVDLVQKEVPDYLRQEVVAQHVRLHIALERPAAAELALLGQGYVFGDTFSHPELPAGEGITHSMGLLYNSSLRVLLYHAQTKQDTGILKHGIALANQVIQRALKGQSILVAMETHLLRAQMHGLVRDHPASQADIARALELAEPEEILGVFVELGAPIENELASLARGNRLCPALRAHAARILEAFSGSRQSHGEQAKPGQPAEKGNLGLIEPLTERELAVLRLMAKGLKHKEIAARLFVSLNTVRTHAKSIYSKLGAGNRTTALAEARQRHIL